MIVWKLSCMTALVLAWSASPAQQLGQKVDEQVCQREVRQYLETMKFIRESAGNRIGDKVAGGYMDEAELRRLIASHGACLVARVIRERALPR
jgi:hypothetical protein